MYGWLVGGVEREKFVLPRALRSGAQYTRAKRNIWHEAARQTHGLLGVGLMHQIGERGGVKRRGNGVAHSRPQILRRAAVKPVAENLHLALGGADHRRDWPFERAQHLAHANLFRSATQPIAAVRPACGLHKTRLAQGSHELLKILQFEFKPLRLADLSERARAFAIMASQVYQQAHTILALRRDTQHACPAFLIPTCQVGYNYSAASE